jgi:predicted O-linked N-acetylglucosamine transferase (SPINDLY family)
MDQQSFLDRLPQLYNHWGQDTVCPCSNQFQIALNQIQGMTTANVMQLLNWAVACMDQDEVYCEVGTYLGSTLIGALLNQPDRVAYAVDNFAEYNPQGNNLEQLLNNIHQFGLEEQIYFYDQDFEAFFFDLRTLEEQPKIGVYFYDGAHDYRSVLVGLLLVKPFLADNALIIVDDYNWATVQQAVWDFIASHHQCVSSLELMTPVARYPTFWNGIQVIAWQADRQEFTYPSEVFRQRRQSAVVRQIYELQMFEQNEETVKSLYVEAVYAHQQKDYPRAKEKYQKFLAWSPDHAQALLNLGILYFETERYIDAIKILLKAAQLDSENGIIYYYLGISFEQLADWSEALRAYQLATNYPSSKILDAYNNLGNLWLRQANYAAAQTSYRKAIDLDPTHIGSTLNLGNLLLEMGHVQEAISTYQAILAQDQDHKDALHNLQYALAIQDRLGAFHCANGDRFYQEQAYARASYQYEQALATGLTTEAVYVKAIDCLAKLDQSQEIEKIKEAIDQHPKSAEFHIRFITKLFLSGNRDAEKVAEEAFQQFPNHYAIKLFHYLLLPLVYQSPEEMETYWQRYNWGLNLLLEETRLDSPESINSILEGINRFTTFYLAYQARNIIHEQRQYGSWIQQIMQVLYPDWSQKLEMPPIAPKIRVGYLSHYFYSYSGTLWLTGWLKYCDRDRFEVYCYHIGDFVDPITDRFKEYSHIFHHFPLDLKAACQQVLADRLHILVFPEIGMNPQTIQIAALRLAPIQCTAWGHPVTSGLATIDYFLSSELMEPENGQEHYTETLVRLPHLGISYPKPQLPSVLTRCSPTRLCPSRQDFGLEADSIVYLCCQAPFKYLPQHDYLLTAIAQAVPQAKFVFIRADILKSRLAQAFQKAGIAMENHCIFLPVQARNDYLTLNFHADVYLDTLGFTGGNTTLDALACGLPVVTCPGTLMRGRLSFAMLTRIGVTETIAKTEAEYIAIAVRLGLDPAWRETIQAQIQANHPCLYEDQESVKGLEAFYQQVVQERLGISSCE